MERYNFKIVEKKWQSLWMKNKSFKSRNHSNQRQIEEHQYSIMNENKIIIRRHMQIIQKQYKSIKINNNIH